MTESESSRPPSALVRTAAAGAVVAGAIAALDLVWGGAATAAPTAFGLGALVGGFGGGVVGLLSHGPRRRSHALVALGALALVALSVWAIALGALRRWGSEHHGLALGLWALVPVGTAAVVSLGAATRVDRLGERRSWAADRRWAAPTLALAAVALALGDARLFPDTYPLFHRALKTLTWLAATAALATMLERRPLPAHAGRLLGAGLLLTMPLALLTAQLSAPTTAAIAARPWSGFLLERLRSSADVDGDSFAGVLHGGDCAPFDPAVGPGAVEVPGNGVDDDCVGGDAAAWMAPADLPPVPRTPSPRSVLLITIDALRADRLGLYGHDRPTSPNIDRFFGEGALLFERAYTAGGYTSIALPALMRGAHARRIQWARVVQTSALRLFRPPLPELPEGERWIYSYTLPIDDPRATWPALLERRGMVGFGVVDDGASDFLSPRWGTGEGFARYQAVDVAFGAPDGDERVLAAALPLLERTDGGGRTFAWLHLYGTHWPDSVHAGLPVFGDSVADAYDHEIAHVDRVLAPLFEHLAGEAEAPVVILTSDHGEVLHADGRSHGRTMDEAAIRVPLMMRGPGVAPGRRRDVVSTLDVFPTLLALTETPAPAHDGRSLLAEPEPERVVLIDSWVYAADGAPELDLTAAVHAGGKLVVDRLRQTRTFAGDAAIRPRVEAVVDRYYRQGATPRIDGGNLAAR